MSVHSGLPNVDAETLAAAQAHLTQLAPDQLMQLIEDLQTARELLDADNRDGARAIVERYRSIAQQAGMEQALDQILADLI
jgi:hypothetical protein